MRCLDCGTEMMNHTVVTETDSISYDICEQCGALWADAGVLDKLAYQVDGSPEFSSQERDPSASQPQGARPCPRCGSVNLAKVRFLGASSILLDRCPSCGGFWLGAGELELIDRELEQIMPVRGRGFSEFVSNVHLPFWHSRVRRPSQATDAAQRATPVPGAVRTGETTHVCPACGRCLAVYRICGTDTEGCPECGGLWLSRDQLRKIEDRSAGSSWRTLRWLDEDIDYADRSGAFLSDRRCPSCDGTALLSTTFGSSRVVVEWCPQCQGIWLDHQEFSRIIEHLGEKLDQLSSADVRSKLVAELREIWHGDTDLVSGLRDVGATLSAFVNIAVFEHPRLCRWLAGLPPV
jgi:Zn-finger nucleic acid-binding protein